MTESILAPIAALALPDQGTLTTKAQQALAFIQGFEITDAETYQLAADELQSNKAKQAALEAQRTAITGPLNAATKAVNDLFRGPAGFLASGETLLKRKMLAYSDEQERLAAVERRRAEEAAATQRKLLEQEAAEKQRAAEQQQKAADEAKAKGDEQAAQLAQAAVQRAQAEAQTATTTAQLVVAAPVTAIAPPKAAGISTARKIDFEVVDLHLLVKHIAEHSELINLLRADDVKLRAYVRGLGLACQLPGVRVFEERVMAARAA